MAYLAKLARADAIAVILNLKGEGYATYVAHNLPTETKWSQGMPAAMLAKAMSERSTEQATSGVALPLSDGRLADTLAVSPVIWKDQVVGGLAAMLAGRAFSAISSASSSRRRTRSGARRGRGRTPKRSSKHRVTSRRSSARSAIPTN